MYDNGESSVNEIVIALLIIVIISMFVIDLKSKPQDEARPIVKSPHTELSEADSHTAEDEQFIGYVVEERINFLAGEVDVRTLFYQERTDTYSEVVYTVITTENLKVGDKVMLGRLKDGSLAIMGKVK